jgi:hypothetical protein
LRDVINQLTTKLGSGQGGTASRVQQRQEVLEMAFPKGFGSFRQIAEQERERPSGIQFWNHADFTKVDIGANDKTRIPQRLRFLEQDTGDLIPLTRLEKMRAHLLAAFADIKSLMPELLGQGWLKCDVELQRACYAEMRHIFPELTLCTNNWKARSLLIEWYGNWNRPRIGVKEEELDDDVDMTTIPAKRKQPHGPRRVKKTKVEADSINAQIPLMIDPLLVISLYTCTC